MLVNTAFDTTHDVVVGQFGPVTTICAEDVSKLLPLIVNENVPAATLVGEILLMDGFVVLTVNVAPFERVPPDPFCN